MVLDISLFFWPPRLAATSEALRSWTVAAPRQRCESHVDFRHCLLPTNVIYPVQDLRYRAPSPVRSERLTNPEKQSSRVEQTREIWKETHWELIICVALGAVTHSVRIISCPFPLSFPLLLFHHHHHDLLLLIFLILISLFFPFHK